MMFVSFFKGKRKQYECVLACFFFLKGVELRINCRDVCNDSSLLVGGTWHGFRNSKQICL